MIHYVLKIKDSEALSFFLFFRYNKKNMGRREEQVELNQQQKEVVETIEGPLLILAGAGSGKTTVAIQRIVHLIETGVEPGRILAVTFTNEAVNELKERLEQAIGEEKAKEVWIHTFHSLCTRILKEENREGFKIVDEFESLRLMNQLVMKQRYDRKMAEDIYKNISAFKSEMVSPKALATNHSSNDYIDWEKVKNMRKSMKYYMETVDLYPLYQKALKEKRSLDLDDLVLVVVRLLLSNPSMLEKYQEKFQFITADEFQDTNKVQYVLLKLLTNKYQNFAAVGDDFQSIFGFRNADIRNILSFEEDFKQAKILKLEENYRSTKMIVEAAHELIKQNKKQKEKTLFTNNAKGDKIGVFEAYHHRDEVDYIVKELKKLQSKVKLDDIAILFRHHYYAKDLIQRLDDEGIAYVVVKEMNSESLQQSGVRLMSAHSAKGLEFPHVYVIGCAENLFPSQYAKTEELIEEERRVFYVCMTRAKEKLTLTFAKNQTFTNSKTGGRFRKQFEPSRFLSEIPTKYKQKKR